MAMMMIENREAEPLLEWSRDGGIDVYDPDHRHLSAFPMNTYVVRATWGDGTMKMRLLRRGLAGERPDLPHDTVYAAILRDVFEAQQEAVVYDEGEAMGWGTYSSPETETLDGLGASSEEQPI